VDILGVDAAILFSDILVPLEAMGLTLEFHEKVGPVFPDPVRDQQAVDRLNIPDPDEHLGFVMDTIRILRRELATKVPLIGFAGAPFTLATYLIEGGSSKFFYETKKMMFAEPQLYSDLLEKITECTSLYLQAQARAGAQALQIFDSWAGVLAPGDYERFALPYVKRIIADLKDTGVPIIYFANNGATLLDLSKTSGADVLGLDWRLDIGKAIQQIGPGIAVQGNMDPVALLLPEKEMRERVARILEGAGQAHGHIFNLGHGIHQFTPPSQAKIFIDAVHELSRK
ncbi:MAG: uroporphyrinogen decarboxylase, partial [Proteobacteria bacterium]|nr:uroporphyrinogen decarboxylase [Pseudomonadota bacterium]